VASVIEIPEKFPRSVAKSANVAGSTEVTLVAHVFDEVVEFEVWLVDALDVVVLEVIDEVVELEVVLTVELLAPELDCVELLFEVVAEVTEAEEVCVELEAAGPWARSA
jgi:hypothetical protein